MLTRAGSNVQTCSLWAFLEIPTFPRPGIARPPLMLSP
jgi:hypothetical protein